MKNALINEKNSTSAQIANLGLSERQRSRALANLALVDNMVGTLLAVSKLLHLR